MISDKVLKKQTLFSKWGPFSKAATLSVAFFWIGCGGSNPTKDYGNLTDKAVPAQNFTPEVKYVEVTKTVYGGTTDMVGSDVLVIRPQTGMFFAEGVLATYSIYANILLSNVTFDLIAEGLPAGAKLERSTSNPKTWVLSWTAPYGTVNKETTKELPIVLRIANIKADKQDKLDLINKINTPVSTSLMVLRKLGQPVVLKVSGLSETVEEGSETTFTVDVKAAGRSPENPPRLILNFDRNGAINTDPKTGQSISYEENGLRYIMMKPEDKGATYINSEGVWRYKFTFIAKEAGGIGPRHKKDGSIDTNATEMYVRFTFVAASGELESEPLTTHLKIKLTDSAAPASASEKKK